MHSKKINLIMSLAVIFFLALTYGSSDHTLSDYEFPIIINSSYYTRDILVKSKQRSFNEPIRPRDPRAIRLESYLIAQNSALYKHSDLIIELSNLYGVNYKMIVAIAGLESGYCRVNIEKNNCWGFGNYSWPSLEEGIKEYFRIMNNIYFSKGRKTIETIAPMYNSENTENFMEAYNIHYSKIP